MPTLCSLLAAQDEPTEDGRDQYVSAPPQQLQQQQQQQQHQHPSAQRGVHVDIEEAQERFMALKMKRDALIVRVYDAKREIASIQAEMDALQQAC